MPWFTSLIDAEPLGINVPAQPSPETPPEAVHALAFGADQRSCVVVPVDGVKESAVKAIGASPGIPSAVKIPMCCGSSTACTVLLPRVILESFVDANTALSAV